MNQCNARDAMMFSIIMLFCKIDETLQTVLHSGSVAAASVATASSVHNFHNSRQSVSYTYFCVVAAIQIAAEGENKQHGWGKSKHQNCDASGSTRDS